MNRCNLFLATFSFYVSICFGRTLTEILSNYDTLDKAGIQHKIYRRETLNTHDRTIDFISHSKKFHVQLVPSREIFDPSFKVVSVDKYGNKKTVHINTDYFYRGYIIDDPHSHVTAHIDDDGMLTASVETSDDTYFVEPMWRHVSDKPSHDMIVYKASDLKWNLTNLNTCGNNSTTFVESEEEETIERFRRAVHKCDENKIYEKPENTCRVKLVADTTFYKTIGREDVRTSAYYMLQVINRVNKIYRSTSWCGVGKGIGLQVDSVEVQTEYSVKYSYNTEDEWNIDKLLTAFSYSDWSDVCLAHLFTNQDFKDGVIGLAYVANKKSSDGKLVGGICSTGTKGSRYHNCGLTTYINWGRTLTTLEATLVTAHEIGHNFGSNHDSKKCSNIDGDGNYIMYHTSVTGENANNKKFSLCSRKQIGAVLKDRMEECLTTVGARCGDKVVEKEFDEQCDEGGNDNDPCCKSCRLINNANCSDTNSLCCENCTYATSEKVCRRRFPLECEDETKCTGNSADCPTEAPKLKSGPCHLSDFRQGECNDAGKCTSLCSLYNSAEVPCLCPPGINACKVCCKPKGSSDDECKPYHLDKAENDGVECYNASGVEGLCDGGICKKLQQNVRHAFTDLLTDLSIDTVVRFMKNNIVLTILIFSLLLWVPASCVVNQLDDIEERRLYEREKLKDTFMFPKEPKGASKKPLENIRVRTGQHVGM